MKAVILAGGFGTRISEESNLKPKPMIEIGGKPILWHIMKIFTNYGVTDFIICLGYKSYVIKEYFQNYSLHTSDVTLNFKNQTQTIHSLSTEPWTVTLVDTGIDTMTGGRLKRVEKYLENETFYLTYGDGVSDLDLQELLKYHKKNNRFATVTAIQPPGRFGSLAINGPRVSSFEEKPAGDGNWINGGFFVLEPEIFEYINGDDTVWEQEPLKNLANEGRLTAYKHRGFWSAMDTLRDKNYLDKLYYEGKAPWVTW